MDETTSAGESRQTAFHEIMAKTAAGFMEEAGWFWVTGFGDPEAEYRAVREGVGVWDVSPLNKWDFRGPDASEAAQRVHSNDILGMQVGQVRYGAFLDEDGLLVDDGTVFKHADDHLWVCTNGLDHVAYFADAAKGLDVDGRVHRAGSAPPPGAGPEVARGAASRSRMRTSGTSATSASFPETVQVGGVPVWLSRTGFSGELGYELFTRPEHAEDLWTVIEGIGAVPYGVDVVEPIRIEAGMVVTDYDYEAHQRSPVRPRSRSGGGARWRRRVHGEGGAARGRRRAAEPVQDAPPRRRGAAGVRRRGDEGGRGGRRADLPGARVPRTVRSASRSSGPTSPPTGRRSTSRSARARSARPSTSSPCSTRRSGGLEADRAAARVGSPA